MARFDFTLPEDFQNMLEEHAANIDETAAEMLEAAAPIVVDELKKRVKIRSGKLQKSIKATKPKKTKDGAWISTVVFKGTEKRKLKNGDVKEVPNAIKAAVAEYGSSDQPATPFIRPAIEATEADVIEKMQSVFNERLNQK